MRKDDMLIFNMSTFSNGSTSRRFAGFNPDEVIGFSNWCKSRRMRWAGHVVRMGEKRNAFRLLVGNPEGKRPLGRPRRRWVNNIRMDLGKVGWGDVDWIGLAQDKNRWRAVVNSVLNLRIP
jgi:hypothetical protein